MNPIQQLIDEVSKTEFFHNGKLCIEFNGKVYEKSSFMETLTFLLNYK